MKSSRERRMGGESMILGLEKEEVKKTEEEQLRR